MPHLFFAYLFRAFMLTGALLIGSESFAETPSVGKQPAPAWVKAINVESPISIPEEQIKSGVFYLLVDRQLKVNAAGKVIFYNHYADYIVNQSGLDESSQISISFDPSYQTLTLHQLQVRREGQLLDQRETAKISLLQREKDLEKLIYDGRLSASIILDDVRVGDIVEYSYSIAGTNPVYGDLFAYDFYTQWTVPVRHFLVRVLWEKTRKLTVKNFNETIVPTHTPYEGGIEYLFEKENAQPLTINSQVPSWYAPYGRIELSDSQTWSEVVNWAIPLYRSATVVDPEITAIAKKIQRDHKTVDAQIHAALHFVQSNIRYLGLEMGENSHKPSLAAETLKRRYGDCKDKTVLLVTLLQALGVEAFPALVNSTTYQMIATHPPAANAFDHVIVYLRHNDKDWWLDPTRQHQQASLDALYQPDFGYGLIVAEGVNELTSMAAERVAKQVILDEFDLREDIAGKASYKVKTHYFGGEAERERGSLAGASSSETTEKYLNFYKNYFNDIEVLAPLAIVDQHRDTSLSVSESYQISNIWKAGENNRYTVDFYANSIDSALVKVEESKRNSPFYLRYPFQVEQTIKVQLPDIGWNLEAEEVTEKNAFFEYASQVTFDHSNNLLTLHYQYTSLANHVPAEKISFYIKARKTVINDLDYSIYQTPSTKQNEEESVDSEAEFLNEDVQVWLFLGLGVLAYLGAATFILVSWSRDSERKYSESQAVFYPVSLVKFTVLGLVTVGLYSLYWFYQNWSYIKRITTQQMLPFWRAFFHALWFYPLVTRVTAEAKNQQQTMPGGRLVWGLVALVYLLAVVAAQRDSYTYLAFLITIAIPALLAYYVNCLEQPDTTVYQINSRWKLRHYLAIAMCLPLLFIYAGYEARLLPSTKVVTGDYLLQRDIKFMQRNGILKAHEKPDYFYSDAFFDIRDDGNGLTPSRVFSYWQGDEEFYIESMAIEDIHGLEFNRGELLTDNSTLAVYREDETDFVLYLSREDNGDILFKKALEERWHKARIGREIKRAFTSAQLSDPHFKPIRKAIARLVGRALIEKDIDAQRILARLYSQGVIVKQNLERAKYFYNRIYKHNMEGANLELAWILAVGDKRVQDTDYAIAIAQEHLESRDAIRAHEVLAAAYAANGEFERAVVTQQKAITLMTTKQTQVNESHKKLAAYRQARPWVQLWSNDELANMPPETLLKAEPKYPSAAARAGITGYATFIYDVDTNGLVSNVRLDEESPKGEFEQAGRAALKNFVYIPRRVNGQAEVARGVRKRFIFELDD